MNRSVHRLDRSGTVTDVAIVLLWFVLFAGVAAVLWWQLTPLPEWTRTSKNATMGEPQLKLSFAIDGWFVVIGAAGGLISGLVLTWWRRRDPVVIVLLLILGAVMASFLMMRVGLWLGPSPVKQSLAAASVGQHVPVQLKPGADAGYLAWPLAAMLGAVIVLWGTSSTTGNVAGEPTGPSGG